VINKEPSQMEQFINSKYEKKFEEEEKQEQLTQTKSRRQEENIKKKRDELLANKAKRESEAPKKKKYEAKDRWKVGRTLLELQKQFPMDDIIKQMVKEEFKNNRVFRYIEEYEVYDEEEEVARKVASSNLEDERDKLRYPKSTKERLKNKQGKEDRNKGGDIVIPVDEMTALKRNREKIVSKLKKEAEPELNQERQEKYKEKEEMEKLSKHLQEEIKKYFELREQRLEKKTGTLKNYIANTYKEMVKLYPQEMEQHFPFPDYMKIGGALRYSKATSDDKANEKRDEKVKQYPKEFKGYFLEHFRQYVAVRKGKYVKLKHQKAPVWIPSSKPCSIDKGLTLGESTVRSTNVKGKTSKYQLPIARSNTFQLHPWNSQNEEIKKKMEQIMGSYDDVENCTFRPYIKPSTSFNAFSKVKFTPADEIIPEEQVSKMGQNFQDKFPDVYKSGMYNKAQKQFNAGNNVEAIKSLNLGFNMKSLIRNLHPNYKQYHEYLSI
jgi:hypothetical protein